VDALRNWLDQLEPRERLLVLLAGALTIVAIVVIGGLRPLMARADSNAQRVSDQEQLLTEIEQVAARLGPQRGGNTSAAGGDSLVLVVDRSTRARNLGGYLKRNQPDGDASIRLRFERAPFDDLMAWLAEIQNQYSIGVVSANIDAGNETGRVNCNLILSRAAG